jgi:DNA-binding transcriptional MerR regulator
MGEQQYFSLDQLATAAGMTARNVRAYQTRGLLPAPVRDGRSAVYDTDHLHRLIQVRRLREAGVPLRMIEQAVSRGENLGDDGPLHSWTGGMVGPGDGEPDGLRPVDPQVLALAERSVPGIQEALRELGLLVVDQPGARAVAALVDLMVRLPSIGTTHPQVLEVIRTAGRLAETVRNVIATPGAPPPPLQELNELAQVAATVVRASLSVHPAQIDLRDATEPALTDGP